MQVLEILHGNHIRIAKSAKARVAAVGIIGFEDSFIQLDSADLAVVAEEFANQKKRIAEIKQIVNAGRKVNSLHPLSFRLSLAGKWAEDEFTLSPHCPRTLMIRSHSVTKNSWQIRWICTDDYGSQNGIIDFTHQEFDDFVKALEKLIA